MSNLFHPPQTGAALIVVACGLVGCADPFRHDPVTQEAYRAKLQNIEPVTLETFTATEPAPPMPEAPAELELTLEQCRAWVLADSLDLDVRLLDPTLADLSVTAAEARFEAVLFGSANYSDTETPTASTLDGSEVQSSRGQLGVRLPLRTGGTLTADFVAQRLDTDNTFSTLNPSFDGDANISLSQPLLRNAGQRVTEAPIQIARLDAQAVSARTRVDVIRVLTAIDRAYWQLYQAQQELTVRQQQHELAIAQLERAERLVEAGAAADVEVIRAQAGVADGLEAIITAENTLRLTQRSIKRLINQPHLPLNGPTALVAVTPANPVNYALDGDRLLDTAMDQRVELIETELQLAQDALNIDIRRNATLPLASLDYRYTRNGLGGSFNDAFSQVFEEDFDGHSIGLRVEVPLGNQAAKSELQRALLTRVQRLSNRRLQEVQIAQEIANALDTLTTTWQRILATRQAVLLEARVLEAEQRQFELGLVTSTQVLEAQARLADARSREVSAITAYQIAQIDLAFATGTVLGEARIRWEPLGLDSESQKR
ncbi:TolC family protein [Algisphaera agarilytica]|uniref:Outer membrane protein TolC n=1 Tax=Algisphaera agarilytica TaxID=1385975 RepID=A0A7X0H4E5_9BACT|nr:TolC family protein [Algisphaera agarilytica]MBB6429098.1 outer membrane protein TolC [Algisphaera agarilytica]